MKQFIKNILKIMFKTLLKPLRYIDRFIATILTFGQDFHPRFDSLAFVQASKVGGDVESALETLRQLDKDSFLAYNQALQPRRSMQTYSSLKNNARQRLSLLKKRFR